MLLIRLLLTLVVVAAGWRFDVRGVFALPLVVVVLIVLLKARRLARHRED